MDEKNFRVDLKDLTLESAHSAAQEFFQGVQESKYNGVSIWNKSEEDHAEIMHIFLEICLQLSSKIVHMKLVMAAFGNSRNSIVFQEILASPQSVLCTLTFLHATMTLEEAQHVHDGLACNKSLQIITVCDTLCFLAFDLGKLLLSALAKREICLKELSLDLTHGNKGKSLSQVIEGGKCPQKLCLTRVCDEKFIQVLAGYISSHNCHLTSLEFEFRNVPNFDILCNAVQENQSLTSLSFISASRAVQRFTAWLGTHKTLTLLQLTMSDLDDEFIDNFCSFWYYDSHLVSLNFSKNKIGPNGATKLLHAIANHPKMKTLDLSWNHTLGFEGLTVIGKALPYLQLMAINLSWCTMKHILNNLDDDERVACDFAGQALLEGMQANMYVQEMDVSCNHFEKALCEKIDFWVSLNQKIGTVSSAEQQGLPVAVWCNIFGKLSCSPKRVYTLLQQQPHVLV